MTFREASVSVATVTPYTRALTQLPTAVRQDAMNHVRAALAEGGVNPNDVDDPEARIPLGVSAQLVEVTTEVTRTPDLSLKAAAAATRGDLGTYEYVTSTCATLGDSLVATCRYQPLLDDGGDVCLVLEGNLALLRYRTMAGPHASVGYTEFALASFVLAAHRTLGFDARPLEVRFTYPAPPYVSAYEQVFRAPLRFDAAHNEIVMPRRSLDLPLVTSDPKLNPILRRYADRMLVALPTLQPMTRAVRLLVRERMERGTLKLREIPAALHLSERTLRRRLASEGTNLQSVVDEMRKELARQYLATARLTASEVAYRLGFANPPSFHRAFQRWFGLSPMRYRHKDTFTGKQVRGHMRSHS